MAWVAISREANMHFSVMKFASKSRKQTFLESGVKASGNIPTTFCLRLGGLKSVISFGDKELLYAFDR